MKKRGYLAGLVFVFTILGVSQKASSSACALYTTMHYGSDFTIDGTEYTCDYTIDICKGGCSSSLTYDVHVQDSSVDPKSKCSGNVYQCVSTGTNVVQVPLQNCVYKSDQTAVPSGFSAYTYRHEPVGCNCQQVLSDPISSTECTDNLNY